MLWMNEKEKKRMYKECMLQIQRVDFINGVCRKWHDGVGVRWG